MKNDARVRYTKAIIRDSFLRLLRTKSVDRITVTELCELAQINRATFYTHYNDCYDLLRSIETEFLEQFRSSGKAEGWRESRELIAAIYDTVAENTDICEVLIFAPQSPTLLTKMLELAREECISRWRKNLISLTPAQQDLLFVHLATGLSAVMYYGFKRSSREELIDFLVEVTENSLAPYMRRG